MYSVHDLILKSHLNALQHALPLFIRTASLSLLIDDAEKALLKTLTVTELNFNTLGLFIKGILKTEELDINENEVIFF